MYVTKTIAQAYSRTAGLRYRLELPIHPKLPIFPPREGNHQNEQLVLGVKVNISIPEESLHSTGPERG